MPETSNGFKFARQLIKTQALTETLFQAGISSELARRMDDHEWALAAAAARVKPPSVETRLLVLQGLQRLAPAQKRSAKKRGG